VRRAVAVDSQKPGVRLVPFQDRHPAVVVLLEALSHRIFGVIVSRAQAQSFLDGRRSNHQLDDRVYAARGEEGTQRHSLSNGARVAVEEKALLHCVGFGEACLEEAQHDMVGHEMSAVQESIDLGAERRWLGRQFAQEVASGEMRDPKMSSEGRALCAFAGPRSAKDDEPHRAVLLVQQGASCNASTAAAAIGPVAQARSIRARASSSERARALAGSTSRAAACSRLMAEFNEKPSALRASASL
jgi:hypothetical protein